MSQTATREISCRCGAKIAAFCADSINAERHPHLAGQPAGYLVQQLRAYRSGARKHEVMSVMAKPLSDADIDALSAWFAAIRVEVAAPR